MNSHNYIPDADAYRPATADSDAEAVSRLQNEQGNATAMQRDAYLASCLERAHLHIGRALVASYLKRRE